MASFAQFLGRRVTVQYRVGDVLLPASGTFSADSGRSIFLEQHVEQRGKRNYFRWEIPYQFIHKIEEAQQQPLEEPVRVQASSEAQDIKQAAAAGAASGASSPSSAPLISLSHRPKAV
jgi:hypothetical protein